MRQVVLILILVSIFSGCTTYNAATGRNEFIFVSTRQEVAMGAGLHEKLKEKYAFSDSQEKKDRLEQIGRAIAQGSDRKDYTHHFFLIDNDELNAFTTPGGNVYCFTGLLDRLDRDDQIAFVLAHEIAHGAARHVVKKYQAGLGLSLIGTVASQFISMRVEGVVAQRIASMSTSTVMSLASSAYGRKDEFEADRLGIRYMTRAGYDPQGAIEVLNILEKRSNGPDIPTILRTHPHLKDRIKKIQGYIDQKNNRKNQK